VIPALSPGGPSDLVVECTVCHVAGVVEAHHAETSVLRASWTALPCPFTDGCIGHAWPDAAN
jgi:hypothetical protein